jgi:hypothetical protein
MFPLAMFLSPKHLRQQQATVAILLALDTLSDMTQIEMIIIAKAKEGNIASLFCGHYHVQTSPV